MRIIGETIFDIAYLVLIITTGCIMIVKSRGEGQYRLFGVMAVVLGCGDAFHLVPRVIALCTSGMEEYTAALGVGKLVTSVTMTVFYVILYHVWRMRYKVSGRRGLSIAVYALAIVRIALCLFPQNKWTSPDASWSWGIYRNIPFAILGIVMIVLFFRTAFLEDDPCFRFMWLAIVLSFGFYIPVVIWADTVPAIGALMLPKTCAYVWAVMMGYTAMKKGK